MSWILPAAMTAFSLGSSLFGGSKSAKAARAAQRQLDEEKAQNEAWYRRKYNEDYADTAAGQNMIRLSQDYAKNNWQKAEGAAAVAGGETEATARAKEQGNKVVGNTLSNMAAQDTNRKDNADASYRNTNARLTNQQIALDQQKAANISSAASQASNALASGAATLLQGKMQNASVPSFYQYNKNYSLLKNVQNTFGDNPLLDINGNRIFGQNNSALIY